MIYSNIINFEAYIKDFDGDKEKAYQFAVREDDMLRCSLIDTFGKIKRRVVAVGEIDGEPFVEYIGDTLGDIFRFNGYGEIYADGYEVKGKIYTDCVECVTYYQLMGDAPADTVEKLMQGDADYMRYCVSVYEHFDTYEVAA